MSILPHFPRGCLKSFKKFLLVQQVFNLTGEQAKKRLRVWLSLQGNELRRGYVSEAPYRVNGNAWNGSWGGKSCPRIQNDIRHQNSVWNQGVLHGISLFYHHCNHYSWIEFGQSGRQNTSSGFTSEQNGLLSQYCHPEPEARSSGNDASGVKLKKNPNIKELILDKIDRSKKYDFSLSKCLCWVQEKEGLRSAFHSLFSCITSSASRKVSRERGIYYRRIWDFRAIHISNTRKQRTDWLYSHCGWNLKGVGVDIPTLGLWFFGSFYERKKNWLHRSYHKTTTTDPPKTRIRHLNWMDSFFSDPYCYCSCCIDVLLLFCSITMRVY